MDSDGSVIAAVIGGDEGDESSTGTIWLSVDYGATWTEQIPPPVTMPGTKNWQAITSNADGSKLAACVGDGSQEPPGSVVGNIWTYDSAGGVPAEWTGICCNTDGARMAVCNTTHIYISSDSGATLEQKQIATAPAEWSAIACSDDFIFQVAAEGYGTSTGRVWLSIDGGENWTQNAGAPAAQWKSVTINNDGTMIAAVVGGNTTNTTTAGSIWISEDSGVTWSEQTPIPGTKSWQSITSNTDGTMLAAAVGDGKQSPTGTIVGNIWTSVGGAPPEWTGMCCNATGDKFAACNANPHIYIGGQWCQSRSATGRLVESHCLRQHTHETCRCDRVANEHREHLALNRQRSNMDRKNWNWRSNTEPTLGEVLRAIVMEPFLSRQSAETLVTSRRQEAYGCRRTAAQHGNCRQLQECKTGRPCLQTPMGRDLLRL